MEEEYKQRDGLEGYCNIFMRDDSHLYLDISSRWWQGAGEALPCGSDGKESACTAGNLGPISGLERSPGERNG